MLVAYVDTSVLVAIAFGEPEGASALALLRQADRLVSSTLLESELCCALKREGIEGSEASALLAAVSWIHPRRRLTPELAAVLETGYLRGADAHHLACALFLFREAPGASFWTLDRRQEEAARALGFATLADG
jgi:predicted nucleic acid-binding protein